MTAGISAFAACEALFAAHPAAVTDEGGSGQVMPVTVAGRPLRLVRHDTAAGRFYRLYPPGDEIAVFTIAPEGGAYGDVAAHLAAAVVGCGEPGGRTYTDPSVLQGIADGAAWADPVMDPAQIDWAPRQARAAIPFEVVNGRPVNPCESTGIRYGRNEMGHWGEQQMADALVTVTVHGTPFLLMIERGDGHGWAVPGGHVEPGETGMDAALPPRYVPDPRASDEAWAVTWPVHVELGDLDALPAVSGGDDARRVEWIPARSYFLLAAALTCFPGGRVFAAHVGMLREFLGSGERES